MPRSVLLHTHRRRKQKKIKRRREWEREARQNESGIPKKKEEVRLEVRIIKNYNQESDHSNFV